MRPLIRREKLLELLRENGRMTVDVFADQLKFSQETIRRDLKHLAAHGQIRKFHGGAALPEPDREGPFQLRMTEHIREKHAIARAAAALFRAGDALFIDTGTTTILFAEELARLDRITVISNSVSIAQTVASAGRGNRAFLIGGEYRHEAMESVGALSVHQIASFHALHAVITIGGLGVEGAMDFTIDEAEVARAMVAQAQKVTVIADSSKFEKGGMFRVAHLEDIDRLVTNARPQDTLREALAAAEVELLVAPPHSA